MNSNNLNLSTILYMAFDLLIILVVGAMVYLKIIGNDLLLIAIGAVLRGGFGVIPTASALAENTLATKANTAATQAVTAEPLPVAPPTPTPAAG